MWCSTIVRNSRRDADGIEEGVGCHDRDTRVAHTYAAAAETSALPMAASVSRRGRGFRAVPDRRGVDRERELDAVRRDRDPVPAMAATHAAA